MAYGNWGAIIANNGKLRMDLCDYYDKETAIGNHAVVFIKGYVFSFYKNHFPSIYKENDGDYDLLSDEELFDMVENKYNVEVCCYGDEIDDFNEKKWFNFDKDDVYFDFKDFSIKSQVFYGIRFWKVRQEKDVWYIFIGCNIGNGFKSFLNPLLKKYAKKGFCFDFPAPLRLIFLTHMESLKMRVEMRFFDIKWKIYRRFNRLKTIFRKGD